MQLSSKKFILVLTLTITLLSGSVLGLSCSSDEDESDELPSTPQDTGSPEGMSPGPGLSDDFLAEVAETLSIDQQALADAFAQAQSEMAATMPEDRQPPEGMSPEDMPENGQPPEVMSPELGLSEVLLANVAAILGIDQQELADAVEQAWDEMASETAPPSPKQ